MRVLASPQGTQVSRPRASAAVQVRGPDWKIPCLYHQPLDTAVSPFEERLGREDSLPIQLLMLAAAVGACRALGLARSRQLTGCELQAGCLQPGHHGRERQELHHAGMEGSVGNKGTARVKLG